MLQPIYLDNNATTRPDPRVVDAMLPFLRDVYGNAASHSHAFGWQAENAVDTARKQAAALIGADPQEIVFTSGATEADNLALKGVAEAYAGAGDHIITCVTEHKAVLDSAKHLEKQGKTVTYLGVDRFGQIDPSELEAAITPRTVLVSIMMANNEIGTRQPIAEIGQICRRHAVLFHTDATQAVGKIPVDVGALGIDLLSWTAHKMHGPKGVGALYVRRRNPRVRLMLQMDGGGHERGFRSGTLNVPGIAGFGMAAELCRQEFAGDAARMQGLRDTLHAGLRQHVPEFQLNGHPEARLPNTLNACFGAISGDALLANLPGVALSSGSACSSASISPSHVLKAIGLSDQAARNSIRFSLSKYTTDDEIQSAITQVAAAVRKLGTLSGDRALAAR